MNPPGPDVQVTVRVGLKPDAKKEKNKS
jgi:hypothetical protein